MYSAISALTMAMELASAFPFHLAKLPECDSNS
jgi:hypothetical protein